MSAVHALRRAVPALAAIGLLSGFQAPPGAPEQLAALVRAWLSVGQPAGWDALDALPGARWAALPPAALQNCLPDGGCFARQGALTVGGRNLTAVASGARTMVLHLYFRNTGAPLGESAALAALTAGGITPTLARCPIRGGAGTTSWYRLSGAGVSAAVLAVQQTRGATPTEGFVLSSGEELPALQPNQLAMYTTDCTAGAPQRPVSTLLPHQRLAAVVTTLLIPAANAGMDWAALRALPTDITWNQESPIRMDRAALGDPNPLAITGTATYAERRFSVVASGTPDRVLQVELEEGGQHPRGEHMLGVVYERGVAVRLVRCGPVYTSSTNNWYALTSARTRPAMILQAIRYDGNQVSDRYVLRLDGTLPARDPRDREPGVGGCA